MLALSQMAEQLNSKFGGQNQQHLQSDTAKVNGNSLLASAHQHSNESVDLDNLFAFLSEVTPGTNGNNVMDEIESHMSNLVENLDVELESMIRQEIEGIISETPNKPPTKKGIPTLPEPTMPPPPPPVVNGNLFLKFFFIT